MNPSSRAFHHGAAYPVSAGIFIQRRMALAHAMNVSTLTTIATADGVSTHAYIGSELSYRRQI